MKQIATILSRVNWSVTECLWMSFGFGLAIYGESIWRYTIIFFGLLLIVIARKYSDWSVFTSLKYLWLPQALWLFTSLISTYFSVSIPASIQSLSITVFGIVWFWFVAGVRKQRFSLHRFILLSGWFLGILGSISVICTLFFPAIETILPRLNYLYSSFGHNHLSTAMALLLPFIWMRALSVSEDRSKTYIGLGLWLVLLVGMMLGRVAILVVLFTLAILIFWQRRSVMAQQLRQYWIVLVVFLSILLGFKQWLVSTGTEKWLCTQDVWKQSFCQDSQSELRWHYWQQAWEVGKNNWLIGAGPGTFSMTSKSVMSFFGQNTAFAHQWLLGTFAENGVIGVIAYVVLFGSFIVIWWKRRQLILGQACGLSIVSLLVLSSVDFDNQLFVIWIFFLTLVGLCVRHPRQSQINSSANNQLFLIFVQVLGGSLLLMSVLTTASLILFKYFGPTMGLKIWPFLPIQPNMLTQLPESPWDAELLSIYRNHPDMLLVISGLQQPENTKQTLKLVAQLDPWRGLAANQLADMRAQSLNDYETEITYYWQKVHQAQLSGNELTAEHKLWFADNVYYLSKRLFESNQLHASGVWLVRAQQVDPWVLSTQLPFVDESIAKPEMIKFSRALVGVNRDFFGDNQDTYTQFFNKVFLLRSQLILIETTDANNKYLEFQQTGIGMNDSQYADFLIQKSADIRAVAANVIRLLPTEAERYPYMVDDVVLALLSVADASRKHNAAEIADLYGLAMAIRPWVLNGYSWWFIQPNLSADDHQAIELFIAKWKVWEGDGIGHNPEAFIKIVRMVKEQAVVKNDFVKQMNYSAILTQLQNELDRKNK